MERRPIREGADDSSANNFPFAARRCLPSSKRPFCELSICADHHASADRKPASCRQDDSEGDAHGAREAANSGVYRVLQAGGRKGSARQGTEFRAKCKKDLMKKV